MKMKVPFSSSNCNPILHMLIIVVFCFLLEATNELTVTRKLVHCCKASVTPGNISRYLSRKLPPKTGKKQQIFSQFFVTASVAGIRT